jgi:hypothetical protein
VMGVDCHVCLDGHGCDSEDELVIEVGIVGDCEVDVEILLVDTKEWDSDGPLDRRLTAASREHIPIKNNTQQETATYEKCSVGHYQHSNPSSSCFQSLALCYGFQVNGKK